MAGVHEASAASIAMDDGPLLTELPALQGSPVLDAGEVLEFLKANAYEVPGDTVMAKSDGTVHVDLPDSARLRKLWATFSPGPPPPSPEDQRRADLVDSLDAVDDVPALKDWIKVNILPVLARG